MRIAALALLVSVFSINTSAAQSVESEIAHVTVFLSGAEVSREANRNVVAGQQTFTFTGLTPSLDPSSLQLKADGDLTILSVVHRMNYFEDVTVGDEVLALRAELKEKRDSLALIDALQEVNRREESLLSANLGLNDVERSVPYDQLAGAAQLLRDRLTAIKQADLELRAVRAVLGERMDRINQQLAEMQGQQRREPTSEVDVTVQSDQVQSVNFVLSYFAPGAGWFPQYDVRVADVGEPVTLGYHAQVYQETREDWQDVSLTLSTGNPTRSGSRPELSPWRLGFYTPGIRRSRQAIQLQPGHYLGSPVSNPRVVTGRVRSPEGNPLPGATVVVEGSSVGASTDLDGHYRIALPANAAVLRASFVGFESVAAPLISDEIDFVLAESMISLDEVVVVREGALFSKAAEPEEANMPPPPVPTAVVDNPTNVSFEILLPYSIPADGQTQLVQIQQNAIDASYRYFAAPKMDSDAFLTASIIDWEAYNLLSGQANLFLGDTYVGQSFIDVEDGSSDTLEVSLGRDAGIVITREKQRDYSKKRILGGRQVEDRQFEIEVRNGKSVAVELQLQDQVPIPQNNQIDVDVDLPNGVAHNEETGILTWELTLAPGESKTLNFGYTVTYPRNQRIRLE